MHDLVIRNGLIVDGSGKKPYFGDIAIDNENILLVSSSIREKGKEEIDAEGKLVTPGWVDIHTHYD
jgi:N-acyl-D-amino-acid deacylase